MKRTHGKPLSLWLCVVLGGMAWTAAPGAAERAPDGGLCPGAYAVKVPPGLGAAQRDGYGEPVWQQAGRRGQAVGLASGKELVEVVACRDGWCQVRWRGKSGWLPEDSLDGKGDGCRAKPAAAEASPKPAVKKPVAATPWAVSERRLVRTNAAGEVECLARDGLNCDYDGTPDDPLLKSPHPPTLACGDDYRKKHGYTGYDTPGHWCWRSGAKLVPGKAGDWTWGGDDIAVFWRIGPDGDPECASRNGHDCLWGNRNRADADVDPRPLRCGAHHKAQHGITGYESEKHWCYRLAARYAPERLK